MGFLKEFERIRGKGGAGKCRGCKQERTGFANRNLDLRSGHVAILIFFRNSTSLFASRLEVKCLVAMLIKIADANKISRFVVNPEM